MNIKTIELLFENETNMELVSKILDEDTAFLYSLLRLSGCNECPDSLKLKLGIIHKDKK